MSFVSRAWSTSTLERGLGLLDKVPMSFQDDPDPEAMKTELARLEESHLNFMCSVRNAFN